MKKASCKQKGTRVEREITNAISEAGVDAKRVVGSGAFGIHDDRLHGDIQIGEPCEFIGEAKARKSFSNKTFEGWLDGNDLLFLRKDGDREPRVYMPWATFIKLLKGYYE